MRALVLGLLLAGCATKEDTSGTMATAVWVPCQTAVPSKPVFPAETLTGKEDLFTIGKTLYADVQARVAYETDLRTRLEGCTGATRP